MVAELNVASTSDEEIGRDMSNFADFPFYYGRPPIRYGSVESFYQMLTQPDVTLRKSIAKMPGKWAKSAGNSQTLEGAFEGQTYVLGSAEHHELIKDAIRAKLTQNPGLAVRFVATRPRPLVHIAKGKESRRFPSAVFCRILTELREEFASGREMPTILGKYLDS
jgi:hypothetical protein